ncbi:hypothetical protein OPQ81_000734 [Rhizoctonia solani]|nr:hypothetical protein OPQ81_000734 [Rhizoctonia solani]
MEKPTRLTLYRLYWSSAHLPGGVCGCTTNATHLDYCVFGLTGGLYLLILSIVVRRSGHRQFAIWILQQSQQTIRKSKYLQ